MAALKALKYHRILKCRNLIQQCIKCKSSSATHTHYDTLGVSRSATAIEIKNAYIKKTKKLHPDKSKNGDHEELFKVQEAYKILSKEQDKKEYDSMIFAAEDYERYRQLRYNTQYSYSGPQNAESSSRINVFSLTCIVLVMLWVILASTKIYRANVTAHQIAATHHDWDRPIQNVIKNTKQP